HDHSPTKGKSFFDRIPDASQNCNRTLVLFLSDCMTPKTLARSEWIKSIFLSQNAISRWLPLI
ncbi:MAG TPA: hypothetical protein PKX76_10755, partial [Flexilinea sp.]|nr:hypothetical protein [Flexilinea sp.]